MAFEDYNQKPSIVVVYTGNGKGKTSGSLGLMVRGLGGGFKVAFVQFIKVWEVSEHRFINDIKPLYGDKLFFYKGGAGFYNAGSMSAKNVTVSQHKKLARDTYKIAYDAATSGDYQLVICDEINNAVADGLLGEADIEKLIRDKHPDTNLCLTGRNFPESLVAIVDIATDMTKIKHHFDDKVLANKGIDY